MPYFTTPDGTRLHYALSGSGGPPLLLIHGFCSNLRHWERQARAFSHHHRVLRVDLRGHGRSDAPEGGYTIRQFAEDVSALARSLRVRDAVVAGHSMGGMVALELARRHPERVGALVMVDSRLTMGSLTKAEIAESPFYQHLAGPAYPVPLIEFYSGLFAQSPDQDLAARVVADAAATPRHAALGAMRALLAYRARPAAKQVRQPALFVAAAASQVTSQAVRKVLPQAQFAQVVGAGHFLQLEAPEQLNAMLRRFIDRL